MYPCNQCLENSWDFKLTDGWVRATCKFCGFEVEFESKKKEKEYAKDYCLKCKSRLNIYSKNKCKPGKNYYYKVVRKCPKCKVIWLNPNDIVYPKKALDK